MKKIIVLILALFMFTSLSGYSYSRKCKRCMEERKTNKSCMTEIGIATRDFSVPVKYIDGVPYATYRCSYGHHYLVSLAE